MLFRISHKDLLLPMLASARASWPLWISLGAGLILIAVGCFTDLRIVALGLMVWLTIAPVVAFMIYFYKALAPDVVPNLIPHTIRKTARGYEMRLYRRNENKEEDADAPEWEATSSIEVKTADVVREQTLGSLRVLYLSSKTLSVLYLPYYTEEYENP